jgi:hypothetical protein
MKADESADCAGRLRGRGLCLFFSGASKSQNTFLKTRISAGFRFKHAEAGAEKKNEWGFLNPVGAKKGARINR